MKTLCGLAVAATVLAPVPISAATAPQPTFCGKQVCGGEGDSFTVDGEVPAHEGPIDRPADGKPGRDGPEVYTYTQRSQVPACSSNRPDGDVVLCTNAVSCPDPLTTRSWVFEQTVSVDRNRTPEQVAGPWRRLPGEPCLARDETDGPSIDEIVTLVRAEFVRKRPAVPEVVVRPAPQVLVSARNSFSAGSDRPVELRDTILGLPITITATPRRWVWEFGDGETLTTTTPGEAGTLEVSHAYQRTGDMTVRVTVEWSGTFRVGGFAGEFPIEGVARVPSAPVALQVREARTELVDR